MPLCHRLFGIRKWFWYYWIWDGFKLCTCVYLFLNVNRQHHRKMMEVDNMVKFGVRAPHLGSRIYWCRWNSACKCKPLTYSNMSNLAPIGQWEWEHDSPQNFKNGSYLCGYAFVLARMASQCRRAYIISLWFLLSFFRRPIYDVTEWISTKLGCILTYDCYLNSLVWTTPGINPHKLGAKKFFLDWLWTLTEHISATEHDNQQLGRNLSIYRDSPTCPPNLVNFVPETAENGWRVFAHPLNFRIVRHCQPYCMYVI